MKNIDRTTLILTGSLVLLVLVSGISYLIAGNDMQEQVLFFPMHRTAEMRGEARILPRKTTREQEIELLVKEILLGPFNVEYMPVVPADSKIRSILLRDSTLYLDFSIDVVFKESSSSLSLDESVDYISRSIRFNFPNVKKIVYSVNGNEIRSSFETVAN